MGKRLTTSTRDLKRTLHVVPFGKQQLHAEYFLSAPRHRVRNTLRSAGTVNELDSTIVRRLTLLFLYFTKGNCILLFWNYSVANRAAKTIIFNGLLGFVENGNVGTIYETE